MTNSVAIDNYGQFISVIKQLDEKKFCFTISIFHASTCFVHMCSSSGGQNCNDTASGIITPVGVMMYSWPDDGLMTDDSIQQVK